MCANDTPLYTPTVVKEFGYIGDTRAGDVVTSGMYNPSDDADKHISLFLKCLQRPNHVLKGTISDEFTTEDYVYRW